MQSLKNIVILEELVMNNKQEKWRLTRLDNKIWLNLKGAAQGLKTLMVNVIFVLL